MKKGPYKMKYTNGKKADVSAFPFKESPVKFIDMHGTMGEALERATERKVTEENPTGDWLTHWAHQNIPEGYGGSRTGFGRGRRRDTSSDSLDTV